MINFLSGAFGYFVIHLKYFKYIGALKSINVSSTLFLDYPDTKTNLYVNEIISRLDSLISKFKPKTIYVPAYGGGNIDHDIANYCVAQLQNKFAKIYEFPLYSAYKIILLPFKHRNFPKTPGLSPDWPDYIDYHRLELTTCC